MQTKTTGLALPDKTRECFLEVGLSAVASTCQLCTVCELQKGVSDYNMWLAVCD